MDDASGALRYEYDEDYGSGNEFTVEQFPRKAANKYGGKTYNSVESVQEFFRRRDERLGTRGSASYRSQRVPSNLRSSNATPANPPTASFVPGSYVRHAKYGRGLVLRREGSGDQTKVTVNFPGYGAKKLIEKYAGLEKD